MSTPTTFSLTRGGEPIASVPTDATGGAAPDAARSTVEESQFYGFMVAPREPNTSYELRIGDLGAEVAGGADALARMFGGIVLWQDAPYFESAQGQVSVTLVSHAEGQPGWRRRATIVTYVNPTKLNDRRYHAMVAQLRALAAGLVFDLVSKALRSIQLAPTSGGVSYRSSQIELGVIERVWKQVAGALQRIAADPVRVMAARRDVRLCWGTERLLAQGLSRLVAVGVDPRRRETPRPIPAACRVVHESTNTLEHRVVAGMLEFLEGRVRDCQRSVERHVAAIEADRRFRDHAFGGAPSLYQSNDVPRLQQLRDAARRAHGLLDQIRAARRHPLLRNLIPDFSVPSSPVFRHVEPYYAVRRAFAAYLNSALVIIDDGDQTRVKSTSRMYEQWVFLQLASAFKRAGLHCEDAADLVRRQTRYRFTLDLDRGTRLTFRDRAGRMLSMRYEPWIFPEVTARQRRDSVYHGRTGDVAWSPDVLVEFLEPLDAAGTQFRLDHAIVVDAKYATRPQEAHWARALKYLQIRSTADSRQVVRHLWLVYPGQEDEGITFQDPAVTWTAGGPDRPRTENLTGAIAAAPPEFEPESAATDPGWARELSPAIEQFATGILKFFGFER